MAVETLRLDHLAAPLPGELPLAVVSCLLAPGRTKAGEEVILSFGTALPVETPRKPPAPTVLVSPGGTCIEVSSEALGRTERAGTSLVRSARCFTGLAYLWGGCSGYGVDCSGLTHLVHRSAGLTVPRDAGDQFASGATVPLTEAAAGDLVFFSHPGEEPHHVGFFAGAGRMLHSPGTGHGVEEIELASSRYAVELLPEGRRYSAP